MILNKKKTGKLLVPTTDPKKAWQSFTQAERGAKKAELGTEKFIKYKDSIKKEASERGIAHFARTAAMRGMTPAELNKKNIKDKKKGVPDGRFPGKPKAGRKVIGCAVNGKC